MISADSCSQLVGGNYDVNLNESSGSSSNSIPSCESFKRILNDFLERFEQLELELAETVNLQLQQNHQQQQQSQQQQQQQQQQPQQQQSQSTDEVSTYTPDNSNNQVSVVKECGYSSEFKLLREFSQTLKLDKQNIKEGQDELNKRKNRYKDILPFSHTRVVLSSDPRVPGNCYINANYIRGPSGSPQAYVACQGPLSSTLVDFWRMIWECNVSVVVMACNEYESGRNKCEIYWPEVENTSVNYGRFRVTLLKESQICKDFLVRKISVRLEPKSSFTKNTSQDSHLDQDIASSNSSDDNITYCNSNISENSSINNACSNNSSINSNNGASGFNQNESRESVDRLPCNKQSLNQSCNLPGDRIICQFHYTTWPDHGAPISVEPILQLVRLVREVQPDDDRPIVVHCSAGCGRTGTICCIDYVWGLLRRGSLDHNFDLCRIIGDMRQQRMAMVQTLEQYILCHRAVAALFVDHLKMIDEHTHENIEDLDIDQPDRESEADLRDEEVDEYGSVFI